MADHFAFSAVSTSCQLVALVEAIFARGTRDDLCRVKSLWKKSWGGGVGGGGAELSGCVGKVASLQPDRSGCCL